MGYNMEAPALIPRVRIYVMKADGTGLPSTVPVAAADAFPAASKAFTSIVFVRARHT